VELLFHLSKIKIISEKNQYFGASHLTFVGLIIYSNIPQLRCSILKNKSTLKNVNHYLNLNFYLKILTFTKTKNMSLKAVLFDMDGVIVDTEPLHRKAYFKTFNQLGIDVSEDLYTSFTGASTQRVCETLISEFGLHYTFEEISQIKRNHFKDYFYNDEEFDLIPGVRPLIEHYHEHDVKLILASSATMTTINMVFDKFGLEKYFSGKISGADLKESKPHPEVFQLAAEMAERPIENCMVIEDSTNGILAAHRANIFCAAYRSKHSKNQDYTLANIVISDYEELQIDKVSKYF
jgi:HAD superfamily hydrolase (TIGR01509 family)